MKKIYSIKSKIYIFCNTKETEPNYFQSIKNEYNSHRICSPIKKPKIAPWKLIAEAIEFKKN